MTDIEELVLIAGPSCCGKSYLLDRLRQDKRGQLASSLGLTAPIDSYEIVTAKQLAKYEGRHTSRMILHVAIRPSSADDEAGGGPEYEKLDAVAAAQHVRGITMIVSQKVLLSRLNMRIKASRKLTLRNVLKHSSISRRFKKLEKVYSDSAAIVAAYDAWFSYLASLSNLAGSILVSAESDYGVQDGDDWTAVRHAYS